MAKAQPWNAPIHPGEILADELTEIGMSAAELAGRIGVPKNRLYQIIQGKRGITADTALRLAAFFGTSANIWLNLQQRYELELAQQAVRQQLKRITPYETRPST